MERSSSPPSQLIFRRSKAVMFKYWLKWAGHLVGIWTGMISRCWSTGFLLKANLVFQEAHSWSGFSILPYNIFFLPKQIGLNNIPNWTTHMDPPKYLTHLASAPLKGVSDDSDMGWTACQGGSWVFLSVGLEIPPEIWFLVYVPHKIFLKIFNWSNCNGNTNQKRKDSPHFWPSFPYF